MNGNIQSGFVLAVIIAAVLFAGQFDAAHDVARRLVQVGLGVLVAFTVFAGTTAFIRQPTQPDTNGSSSQSNPVEQQFLHDVNRRATVVTTVNAVCGTVLAIAAFATLRRRKFAPLGWLLGGVLLIFFGSVTVGPADSASLFSISYASILGTILGKGDRTADIVQFVALLVATAILSAYALYVEAEDLRDAPVDAVSGGM